MRKKLFIFFLSFLIFLPYIQISLPVANAAETCIMANHSPEDASDSHWRASSKSTSIWLTILSPNGKTGFLNGLVNDGINVYIKFNDAGQRYQPLYDVLGGPAFLSIKGKDHNKQAFIENDILYVRNILVQGDLFRNPNNVGYILNNGNIGTGDHNWPANAENYSYSIAIVKASDENDASSPLCETSFTIKPYCAISRIPGSLKPDSKVSFKVTDFIPYESEVDQNVQMWDVTNNRRVKALPIKEKDLLNKTYEWPDSFGASGTYQIRVNNGNANCKSNDLTVTPEGGHEGCLGDEECDKARKGDICKIENEVGSCVPNPKGLTPTNTPLSQPCVSPDPTYGCLKINTALGDVGTRAPAFVTWVLGFVLGISGGIVLIIMIITGYRLMTSQGDPEKVKNAREALTAAIVGLLFIIFSLVILQLITQDILRIPGFGN